MIPLPRIFHSLVYHILIESASGSCQRSALAREERGHRGQWSKLAVFLQQSRMHRKYQLTCVSSSISHVRFMLLGSGGWKEAKVAKPRSQAGEKASKPTPMASTCPCSITLLCLAPVVPLAARDVLVLLVHNSVQILLLLLFLLLLAVTAGDFRTFAFIDRLAVAELVIAEVLHVVALIAHVPESFDVVALHCRASVVKPVVNCSPGVWLARAKLSAYTP